MRSFALIVVSVVLASVGASACSSSGRSAADAAPIVIDAGVVDAVASDAGTCEPDTTCPCFSNYDCPTSLACVSHDSTGQHVYCDHATRGTGAAGAPCTGESDCASALCVDDGAGGMKCSDICSAQSPCPPSLPTCTDISVAQICLPN